jgi:hypothetical protein
MANRTALVLALVIFAGCGTPKTPKMPTRSGRPEVSIKGKTTEELKTFFVNDLVARGYTAQTSDPTALIFEKRETGTIALLFTSDIDRKVWNRVKMSILDEGRRSHRVVCTAFLVGNRGAPVERTEEVSGEWQDIQSWLESAKAFLETPPEQ